MFSAFPAEMCFEFPLVLLADLKESKLFDERDVSEKFNVSETFSWGVVEFHTTIGQRKAMMMMLVWSRE